MIFAVSVCLIIFTIYSKYKKAKFYRLAKPVTTSWIIIIPFVNGSDLKSIYDFSILLGLLFSLAGDVFLLNYEKYFNFGLLSFLITHVFYSIAFYSTNTRIIPYTFIFLIGVVMFLVYFFRKILDVKIMAYLMLITLMTSLAFNNLMNELTKANMILFLASVLFLISDFILALNKFVKPFKLSEAIVLSTYFSAQLIFTLTI